MLLNLAIRQQSQHKIVELPANFRCKAVSNILKYRGVFQFNLWKNEIVILFGVYLVSQPSNIHSLYWGSNLLPCEPRKHTTKDVSDEIMTFSKSNVGQYYLLQISNY